MRPAWMASLVLFGSLLLAGLWLRSGLIGSEQWPIRWLDVEGDLKRTSSSQVRAAVASESGRGFFAVDLDAVRSSIEGLPWIMRAEVSRQWPDALHVSVVEHRPVARWNETGLFSDRGEVFQVSGSESMQGLARLGGPEARSEEVLRRWQKLRRRLDSIGRQVVAVMLDERGAWTVDLDDGVQLILGREQVDRRVERYLRSQASLQELGQAIRFVDLRYTNGLAVGFAENGTDERSRTELDEDIERG